MRNWWLILLLFALGTARANDLATDNADSATTQELVQPDDTTPPLAEPVERPTLRSRQHLQLQRLQQTWPEQFREITSAYDTSAALYLTANSSAPHGWVILLPGPGEAADSAFNLNALRTRLADTGWHTLSLQLPEREFSGQYLSAAHIDTAIPPATENETGDDSADDPSTDNIPADNPLPDSQQENDDTSAPDDPLLASSTEVGNDAETSDSKNEVPDSVPYPERIPALIDAAVVFARNEQPGGLLVLLGQHQGAFWAAHWASEHPDDTDALLLLHIRPSNDLPQPLAELITPLQVPITEYLDAQDTGNLQQARLRQQQARRNAESQYRLIPLQSPIDSLQQEELQRRIKGWLAAFAQPKS